MSISRLLAAVVFVVLPLGAKGELLFKGFTITGGQPAFSLHSVEDQSSKWVSLGQSFSGYKVVEYDPQTEVLTLTKDAVRQEIRLQISTVKDSSMEDAKTRLRSLKGIDLAYELLRQADQLMGKDRDLPLLFQDLKDKLRAYQNISVRVQEAEAAGQTQQGNAQQVNLAITFLKNQTEELRGQVEKSAASLAARLNPASAAP